MATSSPSSCEPCGHYQCCYIECLHRGTGQSIMGLSAFEQCSSTYSQHDLDDKPIQQSGVQPGAAYDPVLVCKPNKMYWQGSSKSKLRMSSCPLSQSHPHSLCGQQAVHQHCLTPSTCLKGVCAACMGK